MIRIVLLIFYLSAILIPGASFGESWERGKITFWSFEVRAGGGIYVVYIMDADGSNVAKLTDGRLEAENLSFERQAFALSPDCKTAAFSSWSGGIWDIRLFEIETGRFINLTNGIPDNCGAPRWSPDGSKIVFQGRQGKAPFIIYTIYTMNSDGTDVMMLDEGSYPDWSPDGQRIAFVKDSEDIYTMAPNGGKARNITKGRVHETQLRHVRWSPDGEKILFSCRNVAMETYVYVMDIAEDELKLLVKDDGDKGDENIQLDSVCSWSPRGKKIAFGAEIKPDESAHIWMMDSDGGNFQRLTNGAVWSESIADWRDPSVLAVQPSSRSVLTTWGKIKAQKIR